MQRFFPNAVRPPLLAAAIGLAWLGQARAETPVSAEAGAQFKQGVADLQGGRYDKAYQEFKAAYAASPTWKILGNLGIAAHRLERYGEALDAFERYLEEGRSELSALEAAQVQRDLAELRAEVATVTLEAGSGPLSVVDTRVGSGGERIVNRYGPFEAPATLRVHAGEHEFQLDRPEAQAPAWTVNLLPGDVSEHQFDLQQRGVSTTALVPVVAASKTPAERPAVAGPSRTLPYVLWGVGAGGGAASAMMFLRAQSVQREANSEFERRCPLGAVQGNPACRRTTQGDADAANWRTAALVTGIGAGSALIAGALLYWLPTASSEGAGSGKSEADQVAIGPWISTDGAGVSGRF